MQTQGKLRFDGQVVVVTGAGGGLGRAYALLFASRGASVVVNDLGGGRHGDGSSRNLADTVVEEIRRNGGKAVPNYDSVLNGANIIQTAIDTFGRIDILVNNAGILRDKSFVNMTEQDWDMIHNVHLKGAFTTTKAAWPYFLKQKYGRVIVTASNSGLYGNFGQANYSAAKMGLVGFANTLAIEGGRKNIHTNVIVPTAASRLTEDIMPPDMLSNLKPELIAPVVVWLCHNECTENGSIIESAVGWAGKCHIVRSTGYILKQNLNQDVTPEDVQNNWATITDMSNAKHVENIQEATGEIINVSQQIHSNNSAVNSGGYVAKSSYTQRDLILYALGVGATVQDPSNMRYLYENHESFSAIPTFCVLYGPTGCFETSIVQDALKTDLDLSSVLHGEQYFEVHKKMPTEAEVETRYKVVEVLDKGKGAVVIIQHESYDANSGDKLCSGEMAAFIIGAGGFGGPRESKLGIKTLPPPNRKPDASVTQKTNYDQAAIYRLSGDINPLHIDENIARAAGYSKPILHGLCSLGFSVRHVLQTYANGDPDMFKAVKIRFVKPVYPGQTLRTNMWQNGNRIHFETQVVETNTVIISGAYVDLHGIAKANPCSATENLESDAVFLVIEDYVKNNPDRVKSVNAIFVYNITSTGTPKATWTVDLKNCAVHKGHPKTGKADTTLTLEDSDMIQIALGKLSPQTAFMRGKLKITGNIMLAQKLKTLMEAAKNKL